jgi:5-methylcytosine-specific restriction endonuclease McrA
MSPPGSRQYKPFTPAGKRKVRSNNAAAHGGVEKCEKCGTATTCPVQHKKGVTPPGNESHVDHIKPRAKGGSGTPENGQLLCRDCNLEKGVNYK